MGLVDYSDSESDSEAPPTKAPPPSEPSSAASKKPGPKLINRSATGKILVNLPSATGISGDDGPPAKRARTGAAGTGSSRFSGFSSFLPPPKNPNAGKTTAAGASAGAARSSTKGAAPRIGVHLKTSAEAAFSREPAYDEDDGATTEGAGLTGGLNLPPPKAAAGPRILEGQKPEEEVKLVGKPLMFKPLSVARKPAKKKSKVPAAGNTIDGGGKPTSSITTTAPAPKPEAEASKKKVSLFGAEDNNDDTPAPGPAASSTGTYEPLFESTTNALTEDYAAYAQNISSQHASVSTSNPTQQSTHQPDSLAAIADSLNLSAKDRRELFGRGGLANPSAVMTGAGAGASAGPKVVSFDMAREYEANEALRASGDQVLHNPVRSIAPGKHSLRQMVNMVQNNQGALEESFASQRNNKKEAAGRYGWR